MNRMIGTSLIGLLLAASVGAGQASASIPRDLPLSGRIEAAKVRSYDAAAAALAYAAPANPAVREAVQVEAAPAVGRDSAPVQRKTCPAKSWPNLAPRCVADVSEGARS